MIIEPLQTTDSPIVIVEIFLVLCQAHANMENDNGCKLLKGTGNQL